MRGVLIVIAVLFSCTAYAGEVSVTSTDGGSNVTVLSGSIKVNSGSTLRKTFYILNEDGSPITLQDLGVETRYDDRSYEFYPKGKISANEDVQAFWVSFILFDVYGDRVESLAYSEVEDLAQGANHAFSKYAAWRASENDVEAYLTSVAYVRKARRKNGTVWTADMNAIVEKLKELPLVITDDTTKDEK